MRRPFDFRLVRGGDFPELAEEASVGDSRGQPRGGRKAHIQYGPVWELGGLARVVEVVVFPVGETAIEYDVMLWSQRVRIDKSRQMTAGGIAFARYIERLAAPLEGEFGSNFSNQRIACWITP